MGQTALKITSEERAKYQEEVRHFIQETYYGSLQEYIADDVYQDYIIEKLMLESETKYKPEFSKDNTSDRYLTPLQYLQELSRSYSCYEEGDISISVDGIDISDSFFSHGLAGCYVEATYRISIQCRGKELKSGRCRMYCLFPNKAVRRDIRVLQVEPIKESPAYVDGQRLDSTAHAPWNVASSSEEEVSIILHHLLSHSILYWILLAIALGAVIFGLYKKGSIESLKRIFVKKMTHNISTEVNYKQEKDRAYSENVTVNTINPSTVKEKVMSVTSVTDAIKLCEKGKYKEAIRIFTELANKNNASAQYNLGVCYYNGYGVTQDYAEAVSWYRKSAEQGHASAQYNLGFCYVVGRGVAQDYQEAVSWFRKSAEQDNASAQYNLGLCYESGCGIAQDYQEAVSWFRKSAEQGHAQAQCYLGVCYEVGYGVVKDFQESISWFRKSAEQGDAQAQCFLGLCYERGRGVAQDYQEAVSWYQKSAEQGHTNAQCNLGLCYESGRGIAQDYQKAVSWYRKSAEQGFARAQYNLGLCYYDGYGVTQDYAEAVSWYRKSAEQGHTNAQCNLGVCYEFGRGVAQDYKEAVSWYRKSAEQGHARAQCNLGVCYEFGRGVAQDYKEAVSWYRKSAEQGDEYAQKYLDRLLSRI